MEIEIKENHSVDIYDKDTGEKLATVDYINYIDQHGNCSQRYLEVFAETGEKYLFNFPTNSP